MAQPRSRALRTVLLEQEIERLLSEGRYGLSVILSQTLLEVRVETEIDEIVRSFDDVMADAAAALVKNSYDLEGRARRLLEVVLENKLSRLMPEEMKAYEVHYELRNEIVHAGQEATEIQARDSLKAVQRVTSKLHELVYRRLGLDDILEEEERERLEDEGLLDPEEDSELLPEEN